MKLTKATRAAPIIGQVKEYAPHFAEFAEAPAVILISARRVDSVQRHMLGERASATVGSLASAAMAAQNLMLAAHALELGACCMTGALAASEDLGQIAGLSGRQEVVCIIAVGWPAENPPIPARKPVSEILRHVP